MEMDVLDNTGHTKHIWNPDNEAEVEGAEALFTTLTGRGFRAFYVDKKGEEGKRMDRFDPRAEKMILVPQLKGG
jgi:hypothetical protein